MSNHHIDPRNQLNDLSNREWLRLTKSVWFSSRVSLVENPELSNSGPKGELRVNGSTSIPGLLFSNASEPDKLKELHPATFAESDVRKLILFFTKSGDKVFDPFMGSGSSMVASAQTGRDCVGIELFWRWVRLAGRRMQSSFGSSVDKVVVKRGNSITIELATGSRYKVICNDSRVAMRGLEPESVDFVLTSPPYWSILEKNGYHKVRLTRHLKALPTNYGKAKRNLSNITDYRTFLKELSRVFLECHRILRSRKYMCVIVSDFRHGSRFYPFHMDLAARLSTCGFSFEGIIILASNRKHLYPYGMPSAFVPNIHHSYILVFRKRGHEAGPNRSTNMTPRERAKP